MTKKVKKVERAGLRNPVKIEPAKHKDCYLVYILTEKFQCTTMVFTRTCDTTSFLALMLQNLGIRAIPLYGRMNQSKRLGALNMFKAGKYNDPKNYIHREFYFRIESHIDKKLPEFPAQEEEVLQFEEGVREATRLAATKMKESGGRKRRSGGDNDEQDIESDFKSQGWPEVRKVEGVQER
ncbi:hypothetical protein M0R45_035596 [Rubus argutus]|uniref:Helicase C-terminal domain-containing protein n=1 Tax=Rubus argutus TaxID=59490 RepID=A0AAW1VUQ4_RUBAR